MLQSFFKFQLQLNIKIMEMDLISRENYIWKAFYQKE